MQGCRLGLDFRKIFLMLLEGGGSEARARVGRQCRGQSGSGPAWTRERLGERSGWLSHSGNTTWTTELKDLGGAGGGFLQETPDLAAQEDQGSVHS